MRRILVTLLTMVVLTGLLPLRSDSQTRGTRRGNTALPDGVAAKDVRFYSEGIECHGKIFTPKGFSAEGRAPAVALAPDRGKTAASIEKYAAHFASRGLVAMVVDYRGWGKSGGFLQTVDEVKAEYHPFWYVEQIPQKTAALFVIAEKDARVNNETNAMAASKLLKGPTEAPRVPGVTHAQIDNGVAFETAANAAAEWFLKYL